MTPEFLAGAAGIVLSLVLAYVPGIAPWFNNLDSQKKQLVNLGLIFLVSAVVFGPGCAGWAEGLGLPAVDCTVSGFQKFLQVFVLAAFGNVGAYASTKYLHQAKYLAK